MRISGVHLVVIHLLLLSSCSTNDHHKNILYQSFANELENMRRIVTNSSDQILAQLDSKRTDPSTQYRAEIWYAKAVIIHKLTDTAIAYINELKKGLKLPPFLEDGKDPLQLERKKMIEILKLRRDSIFHQLVRHKNEILNVDPLIKREFENKLPVFSNVNEQATKNEKSTNYFFDDISVEEAFLLLSHLENNIRSIENRTINFCLDQVGSTDGWSMYSIFSTLVGQSSTVIKTGETVEITAGVGCFSKAAAPVITFNGRRIEIDEEGTARYKLSHNTTAGKKTVIVKFEYTDQEGRKRVSEKTLQYLVVE
jgi:hypothetical protein